MMNSDMDASNKSLTTRAATTTAMATTAATATSTGLGAKPSGDQESSGAAGSLFCVA